MCSVSRGLRVTALAALLAAGAVRAADMQSFAAIQRGRYLAVAADCAACHTMPGGRPYAGGVTLQTPFGTLIAPNITPDPKAGIGSWTDEEFIAALRDGRGLGGTYLYPAMPYPAYTKMTREDALAIRAYLQTIDPAPEEIEPDQLPFPFDIRATMIAWNVINFTAGRLAPDPSRSAQWNRGRYLVDALGHCGTCHTRKNIMGADESAGYLQGSRLEGWYAPNITADPRLGIGRWSVRDMDTYLRTGANAFALASGPMGEEVTHSSSHMTDGDLEAIAVYLLSLRAAAQKAPWPLAATDARMRAGHAIYEDNCAGCHTDAGTGAVGLFPRLAGSPAVSSGDPTTLIRTVLFGSQAVATPDAPTAPAMPSFAWRLGDAQVAAVITYIRNAWGNAAAAVSPRQSRIVRGTQNVP
ncbi:MAG: cytochrome c [Acetobacteraceae bacterium]